MEPAAVNIAFYQGATFRKPFQWTKAGGLPAHDLTDAVLFGQVRRTVNDPEVLVEFSSTLGTVILDNGAEARFTLFVDGPDTQSLDFEDAVWDFKVTVNGDTYPLMAGSAFVNPSPTKKFI